MVWKNRNTTINVILTKMRDDKNLQIESSANRQHLFVDSSHFYLLENSLNIIFIYIQQIIITIINLNSTNHLKSVCVHSSSGKVDFFRAYFSTIQFLQICNQWRHIPWKEWWAVQVRLSTLSYKWILECPPWPRCGFQALSNLREGGADGAEIQGRAPGDGWWKWFLAISDRITFEASFSSFSSKETLTEFFFSRSHSALCQKSFFLSVALLESLSGDVLVSMHWSHSGNPQSGQPVTLVGYMSLFFKILFGSCRKQKAWWLRSVCQRQQVLPFQDGAAFDADETTALLWSKQEWFLPDVGQWSWMMMMMMKLRSMEMMMMARW